MLYIIAIIISLAISSFIAIINSIKKNVYILYEQRLVLQIETYLINFGTLSCGIIF